jgi:hypothetical protein
MVYDNMRVAVARFVGRNEKEPYPGIDQPEGALPVSSSFFVMPTGVMRKAM